MTDKRCGGKEHKGECGMDVLIEHAKTCPDRSSNPVPPEHTPY
jgi:hypothetical protein